MNNVLPPPKLINIKQGNFVVFAEENTRIINTEIFGTIFFGFGSYINSGLIRSHCEIGRFCSIGRNVSIGLGSHNINGLSTSPFFEQLPSEGALKLASNEPKRRVIIGNDVWIGDSVLIASGITIGDGVVIAGGAVVTKDIPAYSVYGGVPAKLIRMRFSENLIDKLKVIAWWNIDPKILKHLPLGDIDKSIETFEKLPSNKHFTPKKYQKILGEELMAKNIK